ncbi:MAG TPA: IS6 family transposase, partial [Dehalococcoidia bacterium]|nr:IS6 family transposase [Dehalococcoidia bacterium]
VITEPIICKYCGSEATSRFGTYKGTQLYWCKSCHRKFADNKALPRMRTPTEQVSDALNMHYEGMSFNAIKRNLKQQNNYDVSDVAVYNWVDRFTDDAIKRLKDVHPKVGDVWVADETVLKIGGENLWFWDIIDTKTRYLLASRVSTTRTTRDAQLLMEAAAKRAGKTPKYVITDKLYAYLDGVELAFGSQTEHVRSSPFAIKESTALVERFHGTLKDRTKVMRGLKDISSAVQFTDGFLIHYNFFRPHSALKDRTPAQAAGLDMPYKSWKDIVNADRPQVRIIEAPVESRHSARMSRTSEKQFAPRSPKPRPRGRLVIHSDGRKERQRKGTVI